MSLEMEGSKVKPSVAPLVRTAGGACAQPVGSAACAVHQSDAWAATTAAKGAAQRVDHPAECSEADITAVMLSLAPKPTVRHGKWRRRPKHRRYRLNREPIPELMSLEEETAELARCREMAAQRRAMLTDQIHALNELCIGTMPTLVQLPKLGQRQERPTAEQQRALNNTSHAQASHEVNTNPTPTTVPAAIARDGRQ